MAKISLTPAQQKRILFGVLGVIGLYAWIGLFLLPRQRALGQNRAQLQDLQRQVEQTRHGFSQMPAMQEEIRRLTAAYKLPEVTKPPEQQLPELLEEISQVARRSQVRIVASKPNADVNKLLPGSSGYLELQILIAAAGGYHQVGAFLDALEQSDRLLRVRELGVLSNPDSIGRHITIVLFQAYLVPARLREDSA